MSAVPDTSNPLLRVRRRRQQNPRSLGPVQLGGIGTNSQNPFGGSLPGDPARLQDLQLQVQQAQTDEEKQRLTALLGQEAEEIQGRNQSGSDFLPVLTQFARAGIPLPGPVAAIQGAPSFTNAGPDPRAGGLPNQNPALAPGGPGSQAPQVQAVNGTGLTVGGPATAASLARLAPSQPISNPLRVTNPA